MKAVKEIERKSYKYKPWTQPVLTSNGTMGGNSFAVNQSSYLNSNRLAWKAFNADNTTYDDNWHSANGHPAWIGWYNPKPLLIDAISVRNRDSDGSFINSYTVSYSDNGTTYTNCTTGTSPNQSAYAVWTIYILENNPHKYWRLTCNSSSGSNNGYTAIQHITINAQELFQDYKDVTVYKATSKSIRKYYKYKSPATGFRKVDYIYAPAGSYIDTEFIPNSNTKIETEMAWTTVSTNSMAFGSGTDYTTNNIELYSNESSFEVHYSGHNITGSYSSNKYFKFIQNKGQIYIYNEDGTLNTSYNFGTKTFNCPYTMYIFALHRSSIISSSYAQYLKYFDIWNNGNKVRSFIPCERLSDNIIGLYDTLNDTFYTNKGSGTFLKGNYSIENGTEQDYDFYRDYNEYYALKSYEKGQYYGGND